MPRRRGSMARAEAPEDPTASAAQAAIVDVPPEIVAQSLGEWVRAWLMRLRAGQSGVLPVVLGLLIISIVFTAISPHNVFLSAGEPGTIIPHRDALLVAGSGVKFIIR